jgi:hypothetical protein
MTNDYLILANGRRVRIAWNMNALDEFVRTTGKELSELTGGKADIALLRTVAWCCAKEGERMEGKELALTEVEFGGLMSMTAMTAFVVIFRDQTATTDQKKSSLGIKFPRIHFRQG